MRGKIFFVVSNLKIDERQEKENQIPVVQA